MTAADSTLINPSRGMAFSAVLVATLGFSSKAIWVKLAYRYGVAPEVLMVLRMAMALPFYLFAMAWARGRAGEALGRRQWLSVTLLGVAGYYLASLFDLKGLALISASLERLILFSYPAMVLVLSAVLFKRRAGPAQWAAVALAYTGIALVCWDGAVIGAEVSLLGVALVFAAAASFAVFMVGSGHWVARVGSVRFTALAMTAASVAIVLHYALVFPLDEALTLTAPVYALAVVIALVSTVMPSFLMAWGIGQLGANHTALLGMSGPLITAALAYWVLGEALTVTYWLALVLVVGAIAVLKRAG